MNSTFFGLELSLRGLQAQQTALDTTGHNISNANTAGYTRQVANLQATSPQTILSLGRSLSLGTGVNVNTITRARDAFVDNQYRWESSKQGYWENRQTVLQNVEGIYNETSDNSLSSDLTNFWNSWSDLANDPENMGSRSVVRERAIALTASFQNLSQQISTQQSNVDSNVKVQITQINTYADEIESLNEQIKRAEVARDNPNDLRDQRDQLVDELSKIVSVKVVETKDPSFTDRDVNLYKVIIGNNASSVNTLVDDTTVRHLVDPPTTDSNGFAQVQWTDQPSTSTVDLGSEMGQLASNLDLRDTYLSEQLNQLNTLAQGVADTVNQIHQTGTNKIDFFTASSGSITASTIQLNPTIESDLSQINTGTTTASGDGTVAQAISSLATGWSTATKPASMSSASSIGDYYSANIAQLGVDVQQATRMKSGEDVLVTNLTNQRETTSGVSLDEEMTNLVKFQKSYAAAARMVTMMDDMLNTIVTGMGVTR